MHTFLQVPAKSYGHTDTLLDVELKTLANTLADKITQAPFYAVADRLAQLKVKTLGNKT